MPTIPVNRLGTSTNVSARAFYDRGEYLFLLIGGLVLSNGFMLQITGVDPRITLDSSVSDAGSLVFQVLLVIFYLGAMICILRTPNGINNVTRAWPIFLLPMLAVVSMAWSVDPDLTFRRSIAFLGTVLFGLAISTRFPLGDSLRLIVRILSLGIIASCIWVIIFPTYAIHQATDAAQYEPGFSGIWRGIFIHKTALGNFAALNISLLLFYGRQVVQSTIIRFGIIALSALCLIKSNSGSGFLIVFALPILLFTGSIIGSSAPRFRLLVLGCVLSIAAILTAFSDEIISIVLNILGKNADLTGRIPLWNLLIPLIEQGPILGYGYSAGFARLLGPQIESIVHTQFSHAHNSYLEVLIAFGYVGMTICVAEFGWLLWGTARLLLRSPSQDAKLNAFPLSILIVLLGLNHIESLLINRTGITTLLFAILAGLIVRDQNRYSERRQLRLA